MLKNKNEQAKTVSQKIFNFFTSGNYDLVITNCKKNIKKFPEYLVFYNLLGSAYMNIGKFGLARETFTKALKMDPTSITIMNNLANSEKNLFNYRSAEILFLKIIEKKPDYLNAYVNYGNLKRDLNQFLESNQCYEKALQINPKHPIVLYSLAMNYQSLGNFELSIEYATKALKIEPTFTRADLLISKSKKYTLNDKHHNEMLFKLDNLKLDNFQKYYLHFAIAKAYEDTNNYDKSYKNLNIGNSLKKQTSNFDIQKEIKLFSDIKSAFSNINLLNFNEKISANKKIIFILGMPRSGTTLVEQIISSHSKVYGSGELPYLSQIISEDFLDNTEFSYKKFSKMLENHSANNLVYDKFFSFIKNYQFTEEFMTDKAPLNFRWIGLIKIFFPSAKIIHCFREPKDNCLSLYKNLFEGSLNFCYNENDLATYYNLYSNLMKFWKKLYPHGFLDVQYESLINDQNLEIKKIINYCNLDWEENCLNFDMNKNPIKTVSLSQARRPIYNSSVKSYQNFEPYLKELFSLV